MARIYEFPTGEHIPGALPNDPPEDEAAKAARRAARAAATPSWGFFAAGAVVLAAGIALPLYFQTKSWKRAALGAAIAVSALLAVRLVRLALRRDVTVPLKLVEQPVERRVELVMEQLDDRFVVFCNVTAGNTSIEHLIVGPSGVFAALNARPLQHDGKPSMVDVARAKRAVEAIGTCCIRSCPAFRWTSSGFVRSPGAPSIGRDQALWMSRR